MLLDEHPPHRFAAWRIVDARAWRARLRFWLLRDDGADGFAALVAGLHAAMDAPGLDPRAQLGARVAKRHALALQLSYRRVELTKGLLAELDVESTQHVARRLMHAAFGCAVSTAWLDDAFAQPGRRATAKYVAAAEQAAAARPQVVARYAALYAWYQRAQRRAVALHTGRWQHARRARRAIPAKV